MTLRFMLLGSIAMFLAMIGSAAAQQTVGTSGMGTGSASSAPSGPTSLLPEGGFAGQQILNPQDSRTDNRVVSGAASPSGASPGETVQDGTGQIATTPLPMNAPAFGSSIVPPLSGTAVPPLRGDTGAAFPTQQLQTPQTPRAEPQFIVLSGSLFRGTVERPNVISVGPGLTGTVRPRGLSARSLEQGEAVLQGTLEAPRVIALTPATGNVLVVQGGSVSQRGLGDVSGQTSAQIVEVPAE